MLRLQTYGTKVDMWSMGVITYILVGGYPPFYGDTDKELFRATKKGEFKFHQEFWGEISQGVKDMISSMLVLDPAKRASASDILDHPWMNEDKMKLRRLSLVSSQERMKSYIARQRMKKVVHGVIFLKQLQAAKLSSGDQKRLSICQQNAIFNGKRKRIVID